jgi:hypothetical protein
MTITFLVLCCLFALFFLTLFCVKINGMSEEDRMELWQERVGAMYEKLAFKEAFINRMVPFIFILKRVSLTAGCFLLKYELVPALQVI